jgi:ABC-2 type transport system ATP-binding protein
VEEGRVTLIRVEHLVKEFRTTRRQTGRFGALRTLFTRQFDVKRAVDGVTFSIDEGELVGYIGSNGAGKSTTIKMLTGILVPTGGAVEVDGLVPWRERERNALNIGVVFGQRSQLWWDLPLEESFRLVARMYRVPDDRYRRMLARLDDLLGLSEFTRTPVRQLSLGQRMRGDLAAAMLYEPRILYLDEPTVGLDVLAKERVRQFVEEVNRASRTTVILTTHDLADVERLCQRLIVIDQGRILYDGSVERLKAQYAPHRELIVTLTPDGIPADTPVSVDGAELVKHEEAKSWLRFDPEQVPVAQLIARVTEKYPVRDLSIVEPDLEGVVRRIYQEREAERAAVSS